MTRKAVVMSRLPTAAVVKSALYILCHPSTIAGYVVQLIKGVLGILATSVYDIQL